MNAAYIDATMLRKAIRSLADLTDEQRDALLYSLRGIRGRHYVTDYELTAFTRATRSLSAWQIACHLRHQERGFDEVTTCKICFPRETSA